MTQRDVPVQLECVPAATSRRGWKTNLARWLEEIFPRVVGAIFLWAGIEKLQDPSRLHRVFKFDGVPTTFIEPLTHVVWIGELTLGLVLLIGVARRRAITTAILVLLVYSLQLAYLIAADNPPKDCGCVALMAKYASAKEAMVLGLVRNAVLAATLEWVRLRIAGRRLDAELASATCSPSSLTHVNEEDG